MKRPRKPYKRGTVLVSPSGVERTVKKCDWQFCPHCIESPGVIWTVTLEGKYGKQYTKLRDLTSHKIKGPIHCPKCQEERGVAIPANCPHCGQTAD